ncbi:MAG TPA: PAS domain S-box protein, partial [Smithellaceae bacterium]|nr:PAS domain S-box protein [Smithellaceae bacterium]
MSDPSETGPKSLEDRHGFNRFKANVSRDVLNRIILILSILTGLGLIATVFIFQKKTGSAAMLLALLATLIAAKLWMRRGQLRSAAVLMIAGVWLVFGVNILLGGGVHNINAVFFLVLTVIAGLLLGEQATFWVAAVSIAALFGLALLGFFSLLPSPYFVESHLGNLVQLIFALVTTAGALNLALSARDDALGMAHERLADQLKTRQALQESERKHRELVDFLPVAVFESDFEGNVLSGNLAIREMFGFSQADYEKGLNGFEMIHPDDRERAAQNLQALLRGDKKDPFSEYTALRKDGTAFPCAFFTSVILEEEKPVGFRGAIIDLSGQKQAREDLRRAEEKYRTIIEQMVEGYFELDLAGNYTFANDAECKIAGCSREELIGMNNRQYQDEENAQKTYQVFNRIYKTGQTVKSLEVEIIRKDGTKGFNEISVSLKRDAEGRPIGFRGFTRDVTERRRAEETLRLSEERFRGITSNLPGGVYQFFARRNGDMRLNYVSENAQTLLGLPHDPEQFFPRLSACVAPEDRERFFESINEAIRTVSKWNFEGRYIKPTGEEIYLKGISAPIEMEDGLIFNGVILDITDRKRAEAEKQRLEER